MFKICESQGWITWDASQHATHGLLGPEHWVGQSEKTTNLKMHPLLKNGEVVHCHGCAFWWVYKYVFKLDNEFLSIYKYPL